MFLGSRLSGRIYGSVEQNALQVLCGQLAIAIDNAQLFTEVQNAKIYNETLLQNLTTGVIAVSAEADITVDPALTLSQAHDLAHHVGEHLLTYVRRLTAATIHVSPTGAHTS